MLNLDEWILELRRRADKTQHLADSDFYSPEDAYKYRVRTEDLLELIETLEAIKEKVEEYHKLEYIHNIKGLL